MYNNKLLLYIIRFIIDVFEDLNIKYLNPQTHQYDHDHDWTSITPNKRTGSRTNGCRPNGSRPNGSRPNGSRPNGSRPNGSKPNGSRPIGSRPNG